MWTLTEALPLRRQTTFCLLTFAIAMHCSTPAFAARGAVGELVTTDAPSRHEPRHPVAADDDVLAATSDGQGSEEAQVLTTVGASVLFSGLVATICVQPAMLALIVIEGIGYVSWLITEPSPDDETSIAVGSVLWLSLPIAGSVLTGLATAAMVGVVGRHTKRLNLMFVVFSGVLSSSITMAFIALSIVGGSYLSVMNAVYESGGTFDNATLSFAAFLGAIVAGVVVPIFAGVVGSPTGVLLSAAFVQQAMFPAEGTE